MTASSGVTVGFLMFLCLKILSLKLLLYVSYLPICSIIGSVHMMCLVHMTFCNDLQLFCAVTVFCGLKPPFRWVKMALYCSRGSHIGVHRLTFSGFLSIVPIVTVVSIPGV